MTRLEFVTFLLGKDPLAAGEVHVSDIRGSDDFEIVEPEQYLATLDTADAKLYVEFNVELGEGFRQADTNANLPIGVIPVDAIFSPIRKVNFTIEPVHMGRETSRERMYLDIWTDGTISPVEAVSRSSELLVQQLSPFVGLAQASQVQIEKKAVITDIPDEKLNMPVEELDLSVRTMNSLRRGGIAIGFGVSIAIAIAYLMLFYLSLGLGHLEKINPFVAAWLANAVFFMIGIHLFRKTPT